MRPASLPAAPAAPPSPRSTSAAGSTAYRRGVQYSSASLVKAMLLVAYLDRREVRHRALRPQREGLLGP